MIFCAEIGMNHDGYWDRAFELIRLAKESGADIAKFQFGWRDQPGEINEISPERAEALKQFCDIIGIEFMASIISEAGFKLAMDIGVARYKIASRTVIENPTLVERVLDQGKETFISLGWWRKENKVGWPFGQPDNCRRYIFCESSYPASLETLREMPSRFSESGYYGFSDHYLGNSASLIAVSRGAKFIEKHFTLNKGLVGVHNDHILSAIPMEFRSLSTIGRELAAYSKFC